MELPRGSALISGALNDMSRRTLDFYGYNNEHGDGQTYLWRRFLSPGSTMRGEEPAWPIGLEHALQVTER
jgi:hypothetical protein